MTPTLAILRLAPWMTFQNSHPHDLMWPCSLLYAAGIARRSGWQVRILDGHVEPDDAASMVARVEAWRPDVLLIDAMTPSVEVAAQIAAQVRERLPGACIVGVGQHASESTEDLLVGSDAFDGVLRGEIEEGVRALIEGHALADIPGAAVREGDGVRRIGGPPELSDLDRILPPIEPAGLYLNRYKMRSVGVPRFGRVRWGYLLTSRGCPYPCTFCSPTLRQSYGRGFRAHSADRVVDDMARLHRDWGIEAFYTIDDVFTFRKDRVHEICRQLIRKRLPLHFTIQTRADLIDEETCRLLAEAGCTAVKMGIESGVPRILKLIRKNETREQMLAASKAIRGAGLGLTAYYMLGHPTETLDEIRETMRFADVIDADMIQVAFHTPYPGSATWDLYKDKVSDVRELAHYETHHLNVSEVAGAELERLQRSFYLSYYFRPRILSRYLRKRMLYRATDPEEWQLVASTLRYLLGRRGRAAEAGAGA